MDPAHAIAERSVDAMWHGNPRAALVDATPMRSGRGHKGRAKGCRRRESRKAIDEFERRVSAVVGGLRSGSLGSEAARREIREAGLEQFVLVTETREEFAEALATFHEAGYFMWDVQESDGLLRVRFVTRQELT